MPVGTRAFGIQGAEFRDILGWATVLRVLKSLGSTGGPSGARIWPFSGQLGQIPHVHPRVREAMRGSQRDSEYYQERDVHMDSQSSGKG